MAKTLFFVLVALVIYLVVRSRRSAQNADTSTRTPAAGAEEIVACRHCGVHIPLSESIEVHGHRYCCSEHGLLG